MKYKLGQEFLNSEGYKFKIIRIEGKKCDIEFEDGGILYNVRRAFIQNTPKNPNHPYKLGVGYMGYGKYNSIEYPMIYKIWAGMLNRCYSEMTQNKQPTYKKAVLYEEWKCFQNFGAWFEQNYNPEIMQGWELDKDILIKGNKIYSPETCCFVPQEINMLFTLRQRRRGNLPIGVHKVWNRFKAQISKYGVKIQLGTFNTPEEAFQVYKVAKEKHIKEVADKWLGKITEQCYQAMYKWTIEITD